MSQDTTTLFFSLGGPGGLPYGLTFAGQATPWQQTLADAIESVAVRAEVEDLVARGQAVLAPLGRKLNVVTGGTLTLDSLLTQSASNPSASMPGILLAQFGTLLALSEDGFDTRVRKPAFTAGHSQGVLGAALYEAWVQGDRAKQAQIYACLLYTSPSPRD